MRRQMKTCAMMWKPKVYRGRREVGVLTGVGIFILYFEYMAFL